MEYERPELIDIDVTVFTAGSPNNYQCNSHVCCSWYCISKTLFYGMHRIAEREKRWEMKMKEALAKKEQRIRAVQSDREQMIAEVSTQH